MKQSRLQEVVASYRQQLLQHEAQAEHALDTAHAHTLAALNAQLNKLYDQMVKDLGDNEKLSVSWLYEAQRLEIIKRQITTEIDHFAALARVEAGQMQRTGVQLGQKSAMALLQSTLPPGVKWSFGIPHPQAIANMVGATQAGSPLADLFNGFGKEAADGAANALITGVTLGHGPRQIAPQVQQALNISRYRALTIARTEALRSYRSANLATFQSNSDVVKQWRWTASLSPRTCAACLAMDGTLHDLGEDMGSHPNCRCVMTPVTADWSDILGPLGIDTSNIPDSRPTFQSGADWLDGQSEDVQKQVMGAKYQGWKNGDFDLSDVVGHEHDKDWGHSIFEKSLKELVK